MNSVATAAAQVAKALATAADGLVERERVVELVALAAVAGEHLLLIGPPGTAKSAAARRVATALGGRYFEYLLGRFTEPSELFGPINLRRLREGVVETETAGMLPEAEIVFLDEVFLGSTAILNTLLGVLNERIFRRGQTQLRCPLRVCVGASNALPEDIALAAFSDRFLLHAFLEPIGDSRLEELLTEGWRAPRLEEAVSSLDDLDRLSVAARAMDPSAIRPQLAQAVRRLRAAGLHLSDRRIVKIQKLSTAAAVLAGRPAPTAADLWPLIYAIPTAEGQAQARGLLRDLLESAENPTLPSAAEAASKGPAARAARLTRTAHTLLAIEDEGRDEGWRLKAEAVLREMDASVAEDQRPTAMAAAREALAGAFDSP